MAREGVVFGLLFALLAYDAWDELAAASAASLRELGAFVTVVRRVAPAQSNCVTTDSGCAQSVRALLLQSDLPRIRASWVAFIAVCALLKLGLDLWASVNRDDSVREAPTNKVRRTRYRSLAAGTAYESIAFLMQPSNFLALVVGAVQWELANKRGLILIVVATLLYELGRMYAAHLLLAPGDLEQNATVVRLSSWQETRRAEELTLGERVSCTFAEKTPAQVRVLSIQALPGGEEPPCAYGDSKRTTGEDTSVSLAVGDVIPALVTLTLPDTAIVGEVTEFAPSRPAPKQERPSLPEKSLQLVNAFAICVISLQACMVAVSGTMRALSRAPNEENRFDASAFPLIVKEFFLHLAGGVLSEHSTIPSLRLLFLYSIYNVVVCAAFASLTVKRFTDLDQIDALDSVFLDKTGTITDTEMSVHAHREKEPDESTAKALQAVGFPPRALPCLLWLSNSETGCYTAEETRQVEGSLGRSTNGCWGTSVEEQHILKYWLVHGLQLIKNPVCGERGSDLRFAWEGTSYSVAVLARLPYVFGTGKLSVLRITGGGSTCVEIEVRQTGTSFLLEEFASAERVDHDQLSFLDEDAVLAERRRSMAVAYRLSVAAGEWSPWCVGGTFSFENAVRPSVPGLIRFLRDYRGVAPVLLTGDAREAAEEAGLKATLLSSTAVCGEVCYDEATERLVFPGLGQTCGADYVISGLSAQKALRSPSCLDDLLFLFTGCKCRCVVFRATAEAKADIVTFLEEGGKAVCHVGDAANDELAIQAASFGVCLHHGADTCKAHASVLCATPADLVDLMAAQGMAAMMNKGNRLLFKDVCFFCGLASSVVFIAVSSGDFELLSHSRSGKRVPVFPDAWTPLQWVLLSNCYYLSAIAYATGKARAGAREEDWVLALRCCRDLSVGLLLGGIYGQTVLNSFPPSEYGVLCVYLILGTTLTKHVAHCAGRRECLGQQHVSWHNASGVVRVLSLLDSIAARVLMWCAYWFASSLELE